MSIAKRSGSEASDLANKLENYVLNLRKVEAALEIDPTHVDLITLKADLNELIDLTRNLLSESLPTKKTGTGPTTHTSVKKLDFKRRSEANNPSHTETQPDQEDNPWLSPQTTSHLHTPTTKVTLPVKVTSPELPSTEDIPPILLSPVVSFDPTNINKDFCDIMPSRQIQNTASNGGDTNPHTTSHLMNIPLDLYFCLRCYTYTNHKSAKCDKRHSTDPLVKEAIKKRRLEYLRSNFEYRCKRSQTKIRYRQNRSNRKKIERGLHGEPLEPAM